jgi:hypothetical protein
LASSWYCESFSTRSVSRSSCTLSTRAMTSWMFSSSEVCRRAGGWPVHNTTRHSTQRGVREQELREMPEVLLRQHAAYSRQQHCRLLVSAVSVTPTHAVTVVWLLRHCWMQPQCLSRSNDIAHT